MFSDILRRIVGIEVFPIISLVTFVAVFTAVLIWTVRLDGNRVLRISRLPLDDMDPAPAGSSARDARVPRSDS
jgi:hypothetical protein